MLKKTSKSVRANHSLSDSAYDYVLDTKTNKEYCTNDEFADLLNQYEEEIKECKREKVLTLKALLSICSIDDSLLRISTRNKDGIETALCSIVEYMQFADCEVLDITVCDGLVYIIVDEEEREREYV